MLPKVARWSYKYRWICVGLWVATLVAANVLVGIYKDAFTAEYRTKQSDSQTAYKLLRERFPSQAVSTGDIVFKVSKPLGVADPAAQQGLQLLFRQIEAVPHVRKIQTPFDATSRTQLSLHGQIAYAQIQFDQNFQELDKKTIDSIQSIVARTRIPQVQTELGGDAFSSRVKPGSTEVFGIVAATFILLLAFGSVLAMGLPITMALFGIGIGIATIKLLSHVIDLPDITIQLASMIGIGVGIDYALFIVTRYRQNLRAGMDTEQAVVQATNTAGRSVLFAGTTVVISLLGMVLVGIGFISGMGIGAAAVVAISMLASVTLLPAILAIVGKRIDMLKLPHLGKDKTREESGWFRWSRLLQRRPWQALLVGIALLVPLIIPLFSMRLGSSDASSRPADDTTRRAYDLKAEGFGVGFNGPLLLVARINGAKDLVALRNISAAIQETPGVAFALPPTPNKTLDTAVMQVIPTTSPQDKATSKLIDRLRTDVIPTATSGTGITLYVGGVTAMFDDMASTLQSRLPIFMGTVLLLSFLLLLLVFRSVLVPLKAVIMNLLSIGAAYGLLVAVFQWGYGSSLIGVGNTGPIESFVPMIMFAVLFGLSMDYEVFLLSRIKEEYDRTGDNALAVADGLNLTARVITAAALIMVTVFAAFVFEPNRVIKEFGLGLSAAILLDATIVRMLLVPATMELLGKANWWLPNWLQWLPNVHIDGTVDQSKPKR